MKIKYFLIGILLIQSAYAQKISLKYLLNEMRDRTNVARFPDPSYVLHQASSYDRRSKSPDSPGWFANSDFNQFIREEKNGERLEYVMMDADGPGSIVRFWLTSLVKSGTMRFYFDFNDEPTIIIPAFDLMKGGFNLGPGLLNPHSSYEPEGKGGNTLYLPLIYKKHCKVTWEFPDSANRKTPHYYQINYRTYPKGTKAETFSFDQLEKLSGAIQKTENELWHPTVDYLPSDSIAKTLSLNESCALPISGKNQAIQLLQMNISGPNKNREELWRNLMLKISFDDQETVFCPLGDFIGSGYGGKTISSWYRVLTNSSKVVSRWVMPFKENAEISLVNQNDFPVDVKLLVAKGPFKWDDRSMYFHATYKNEQAVWDAKWDYDPGKNPKGDAHAPIDWNFIRTEGKGVYMGNTLATLNHMKTWYGEGDAKAYVDDEPFPSEFGTGLEDYYNTSWAPVVLYNTPFANAPRADDVSSTGHNTFTRTRILDAIPFQKSFSFDMEMLSWDGGTVDISATTYWYKCQEK